MKARDLKQMSESELKDKLLELKKELIKQNAQVALGANNKNTKLVKNLRKDIARILTILTIKGKNKNE